MDGIESHESVCMRSPSVSSCSEDAESVVIVFITTRTQVARLWSKDQSAMLTALVQVLLQVHFCL